ncbi:MAG: aminodeoxychorismate/anthranilate synthase component II [Bacteroidetes bacterium]|nr:aminodeoxychorismate/anthranilate synthase component II [Bacteroidota bacterium]
MKKILVIDNYDSFTYNLVHLLLPHAEVKVVKNDEVNMDQVKEFDKILFSPGPGIPEEAGQMIAVIKEFTSIKPMLGICLGHQAIGEIFGGKLKNLSKVYHGVSTPVKITKPEHYLFKNIPERFEVGRYHSWVVDETSISQELLVTAVDDSGMIMGISHNEYDINGVQFHPESIMTEYGATLIQNWVNH